MRTNNPNRKTFKNSIIENALYALYIREYENIYH